VLPLVPQLAYGERTRLQIITLHYHCASFFAVFFNAGSGLFFCRRTIQHKYKYRIQFRIVFLGLLWQPQTPPTAANTEGLKEIFCYTLFYSPSVFAAVCTVTHKCFSRTFFFI
jgi:hypothetical protein